MKQVKYQVTEITVAYRPKLKLSERPTIITSEDAYKYIKEGFDQDTLALQEQFVVLYLNRASKAIGLYKASVGGITGTVADHRIIFATALKTAAVAMIMAHNHPSGVLMPSVADEAFTRKVVAAAKLLDMKVLDHLIINAHGGYFSFADEGLTF